MSLKYNKTQHLEWIQNFEVPEYEVFERRNCLYKLTLSLKIVYFLTISRFRLQIKI